MEAPRSRAREGVPRCGCLASRGWRVAPRSHLLFLANNRARTASLVSLQRGEAPTTIMGCRVRDGALVGSGQVRVVRDGEVVHEGPVASLKRESKEIREAAKGTECGLVLEGFGGARVGDKLESMVMEVVKAKVVQSSDGSLRFEQ